MHRILHRNATETGFGAVIGRSRIDRFHARLTSRGLFHKVIRIADVSSLLRHRLTISQKIMEQLAGTAALLD